MMTTTKRRRVEGRNCVVDAPATWTAAEDLLDEIEASGPGAGDTDLVLLGPGRGRRPRPRVSIRFAERAAASADEPAQVWEAVRRAHPQAVFTSSDIWPHPVFGMGHLVQTARVEDEAALAHDCYVFAASGRAVRIEVDCALADLLPLEDQLADIVAHVRPKVA